MSGGMTSWRRPPTFIPTTPSSHPGMTMPAPSWNLNGWWRSHEASNCFRFDQAIPTYWTVTFWPAFAALPVPLTMSRFCSVVGGLPVGLPIGGFEPRFFSPCARVTLPGLAALVDVDVAAGVLLLVLELELDFDFPPQPAASATARRSARQTVRARPVIIRSEPRIDHHRGEQQREIRQREQVQPQRGQAVAPAVQLERQRHERAAEEQRGGRVDPAEEPAHDRQQRDRYEQKRVQDDLNPRLALALDDRQHRHPGPAVPVAR